MWVLHTGRDGGDLDAVTANGLRYLTQAGQARHDLERLGLSARHPEHAREQECEQEHQ
jgi:hypothetical protein